MSVAPIHIKRATIALRPDQSRVLLRPFDPGDIRRIERIVNRILSLPESCVQELLDDVVTQFSGRHLQIRDVFLERFEQVSTVLTLNVALSRSRKLLIGSYFLCEYSLESAAL